MIHPNVAAGVDDELEPPMSRSAQDIVCVEVFCTEYAMSAAAGPSGVTYDRRSAVLVRIEDGAGRVGWGETYYWPGIFATVDELGETLVGQTPADRLRLVDGLSARSHNRPAVSVLAIALDDLRARQLDVAIAELYGGRRRDSVRAYASSGGYRNDLEIEESWPAELAAAIDHGFRAAKFRVGRYSPRRELPVLRGLRAAAGPDVDLMVDANGAYPVPTALRVGRALGELEFRWFEEPLIRFRNGLEYPGYEQLASLDIPIAAAEGLETRTAFAGMLARGAASILQPDVAICGGIGEALFVAELAALHGRQCIPHAWGGAVLMAATLQLLAVMRDPSELPDRDGPLLEVDRLENPLRTELWGGEVMPVNGVIAIPTGPGLGIKVDEKAVARLATASRRHVTAGRQSADPLRGATNVA